MTELHTSVVTALALTGLPVHYELFLDNSAAVPCISYQETANSDIARGTTVGYSSTTIRVKVWAKTVSDLTTYAASVDEKMAALGYQRKNSNELVVGAIICKVLDYSGTIAETFSNT